MFWCGLATDFSQKLLKRCETKFYAASTIAIIICDRRIIATRLSSMKTSVLRSVRHFVSVPTVNAVSTSGKLRLNQTLCAFNAPRATFTSAQPQRRDPGLPVQRKHGQQSFRLSCEIVKVGSGWAIGSKRRVKIQIRHLSLQSRFMCLGLRELLTQFRRPFSILART
jgi:hypothetical protein